MADPLRRTLSKLRGKRSKKGPAGGLGAECNGEGKEQRGGTYRGPAEESSGEGKPLVGCEGQSLGGQTPATSRDFMATAQIGPESTEGTLGWCSQNHNNNNDAVLGGAEVSSSDTAGFVLTNAHHSYFNGVEVRYNGVQSGHHSIPHSVSHGISRIKDNEGIFPCGKYQNCNLSPLYPPEYTSYSHSAGAEKQWVSPHSAPVSSCPLTFFYPQPPQARTVQESQTEFVPSTFIPSHSGTLGGSHMVTPEYSAPSQDYSKLVGTSFYRITQNNSEDSEEDDYYDNDNLLVPAVTEPQYNSICIGHDGLSPRSEQLNRTVSPQGDYSGYQQSKGTGNIYLETDRLRSQLQEAYYLLIHAMHDLPLENQTSKIAAKVERCPSSSQSQDSVYSQSSVRAIESDVWSSDEASPKQVSQSDLVSLNALRNLEINRFHSCSKSLDAIYTMPIQETLQKFHSDSLIKYSTLTSSVSPNCGIEDSQGSVCHQADTYMDCKGDVCPQSTTRAISSEISGVCNQTQSDYLHEGKPVYEHVTCNTVTADSQGQVLSQKPSGLTVKKMQKWMYKGRLLSLEMKDRIIGSSQRTTGSCRLTSSGTSDRPELPQTSSSASLKMPGESQGPPVTDLIENVYASTVVRKELKVIEANEHNLQKNRITVSKKRSWLIQSSHKYQQREENNGPKRPPDSNQIQNSYSFRLKQQQTLVSVEKNSCNRTQVPCNEVVQPTPANPLVLPNSVTDHNEDNDADDEGEIWYNPIPEDDDQYLSTDKTSCQIATVSGSDLLKTSGSPGGLPRSAVCVGDMMQMSPTSEINHADALHSNDYCTQLHKQNLTSKAQMAPSEEVTPAPKSNESGAGVQSPIKPISPTATEFSPPSSPNPSKRAGSINWSFPDKIKSPRTVRKLSMKMKKLPELSRKRSIKGTSNADHAPSVSKSNCQDISHTASLSSSGNATAAASRNVISRYHLDSSVSSQQNYKKKNSGSSKSSSKGGYLSDGDSPELIAKSGKHGADNRATKGKEALAGSNTKSDIDIDAFRHYSFSDQPKCFQYISGLMSLHFYGAEDLKPPKIDSKDVFCAIQVDSVNKARTALLTCRTTFLDMDHTFNIELENAQHLKLVVFSWDPTPRKNRVCCHGTVVLPALFRVTKTHQLAVKLEPRGLIYVKLNLMEQWENSLDRPGVDREPIVFGVEARKVVEKENAGLMVPLLMDKCITEIEKRGCQVVGLYRLCGSAAVKKELREAFERDSKSVGLCESQYPDINVITGVLKDYLRELPSPLITKHLYEAVLKAMAEKPLKMASSGCENDSRDSENTVSLLDCLPDVEKATLKMLLDHLKLVASYHEVNKMTCQNLAVCFGPVLLSQRQETSSHNNRVFIDSEELASALDFKKHIEVLHYLLQLWPVKNASAKEPAPNSTLTEQQPCLRRKKPRPQMLNLGSSDMSGVLRPRVTRLDSPSSNRYAGDWSSCRESYLICPKDEADYDDVPSEDTDSRGDIVRSQLDDVGYQQVEYLKEFFILP
uniref:Synapse defective 1, Rho GTPase, homolog 2 n=1 Tax=Xenopus tropicalis TaxID=8364 RepID=F6W5P5_XENTR